MSLQVHFSRKLNKKKIKTIKTIRLKISIGIYKKMFEKIEKIVWSFCEKNVGKSIKIKEMEICKLPFFEKIFNLWLKVREISKSDDKRA